MYFDHSKRSYYRFPSKNSSIDFDEPTSYYFPDKKSTSAEDLTGSFLNSNYNYYDDFHDYFHGKGDSL